MKILSHRGYWKTLREQNTVVAFDKSFRLGYGVETDIRDYNGSLVIDHDLPNNQSILALSFFETLVEVDSSLPVAINIKSDGLQKLLKTSLESLKINNYFLFDMSVPDAVNSINHGLRVFTRQSEFETKPSFYDQASGVWIDSFNDDTWIDESLISTHLNHGKSICLVSPELHKRSYIKFWERIKRFNIKNSGDILLCTDLPDEAARFFNHEKDQSCNI